MYFCLLLFLMVLPVAGFADEVQSLPNSSQFLEDRVVQLAFTAEKPMIPASLKMIVGEDQVDEGFRARLKKVHALGEDLSPSEVQTLMWYLYKSGAGSNELVRDCENVQVGVSSQEKLQTNEKKLNTENCILHTDQWSCQLDLLQTNVLKNDIAVALLNQYEPVHDFPKHLMYMFHAKHEVECQKSNVLESKSQTEDSTLNTTNWQYDQVWRDYCIQFLGQWLEKYPETSDKEEIFQTLLKGTLESDSSVGGTCLISLFNNRDKLNALQKVGFKIMALKLAADQSTVDSTRLTAFQICAMSGFKEVLPLLRKEVDNTNKPSLRMSAVAALGIIGEPEDYGVLQQASKSYDTRVRKAAYAAMKRLSQ